MQEEVQTILTAAEYLSSEYITSKILTLLGDADKIGDELIKVQDEALSRFAPDFDGNNNQNEAE